jgi:hypothetical protein
MKKKKKSKREKCICFCTATSYILILLGLIWRDVGEMICVMDVVTCNIFLFYFDLNPMFFT